MSRRNIKNITLLLILLVYSFLHRTLICRSLIEYSESITVSFTLLFTFLSIKLLGYQKSGNSKLKQSITNAIVIFIIIYLILFYTSGIYKGYITTNFKSFESLLFNLIIIITIEIFRYVIIKANTDKKYITVITAIVITIFEALCFKNNNLLVLISRNILISYLVYNIGFIPGIIYRLCIDFFRLMIPILPDISNYFDSVLYIGVTEALISEKVLPKDFNISNYMELIEKQTGDVDKTYSDTTKFEKEYKYKPKTSLKDGLKEFAKWYKEYYK